MITMLWFASTESFHNYQKIFLRFVYTQLFPSQGRSQFFFLANENITNKKHKCQMILIEHDSEELF